MDAKDGRTLKVTSTFSRPQMYPQSVDPLCASDPATDEELGTVPEMGVTEAKQAIDAAANAFKTWSKTTGKVGEHTLSRRNDVLIKTTS